MRFVKEFIGLALIIVFVITIEIITVKTTKDSLKNIDGKISQVQKWESDEQLETSIKELSNSWKIEEKKMSCYIEHNELEEITKLINSLEFQIEDNKKDNINQTIDEIKFKMEHIENKQKIKLENIF